MNVPKLRFKEFTDEWQTHKLKNLCTTCGGGTPSKSITEYWTGNIPWISSSDLEATSIFKINVSKFITTKAISESATKIIPPNSILIVSRVGVGKVAINYNELCTSQDFTNLINIKGNSIFFTYLLKLKMEKQTQQTQGTSIKGITTNDIKNINCTFPNIKEQTKIANFLSTVDKKISNLEDIITNLENQKKGLLQQIFNQELRFKDENGNNYPDWEKKKLGDNTTSFSGGTPSVNVRDYYYGSIPFIKSGEIHNDFTETFITEAGLISSSAKLVNKGDLLFALYGATSGDTSISKINGAINQAVLCVRSKTLNLHYLYQLLNFYRKKLLSIYLQGGQGNFSASIFKNLTFKFPCLEEQTKIANFLSAFDRKIVNQKAQLEHWKQIKKGLLQQMFV